jgi:activating signal cointegrator complex subunit 3
VRHFQEALHAEMTTAEVLQALVDATEFAELPVRHNEDNLNTELAKSCPLKVNAYMMDSAHTKASLLLQAHFSRLQLPSPDYLTDTKSVMDQALRVLQAMVDVVAESGWLAATLRTIGLLQMVVQARWDTDSPLLGLPHLEPHMLHLLHQAGVSSLPELQQMAAHGSYERVAGLLRPQLEERQLEDFWAALQRLPVLQVGLQLGGERAGPGRPRVTVQAGAPLTLTVSLRRLNKPGREGTKVHAPRYPKPKEEGWVLLAGDPGTRELLALKRVGPVRGSTTVSLALATDQAGPLDLCLYLLSDAYLGLDQQYDLQLLVEGEAVFYSSDEEAAG